MKAGRLLSLILYSLLMFIAFMFVVLMCGCAGLPESPDNTQYRSHLSKDEARQVARIVALNRGGEYHLIDRGSNSMAYGISHCAYIVIVDEWAKVEPGFVIAYQGASGPVIHSVLARNGKAVKTMGSNNRYLDATVWKPDYLGTLVAQIYYDK